MPDETESGMLQPEIQSGFNVSMVASPDGRLILEMMLTNGPSKFTMLLPPDGAIAMGEALIKIGQQAKSNIVIPQNGMGDVRKLREE